MLNINPPEWIAGPIMKMEGGWLSANINSIGALEAIACGHNESQVKANAELIILAARWAKFLWLISAAPIAVELTIMSNPELVKLLGVENKGGYYFHWLRDNASLLFAMLFVVGLLSLVVWRILCHDWVFVVAFGAGTIFGLLGGK